MVAVFNRFHTHCAQSRPGCRFFDTLSDKVITPGYQALQQNASQFSLDAQDCEKNKVDATLKRYRAQWKNTMQAWQRIQWVNFGPITENSREWQIQFWPDRNNIVGQKIKFLLEQDGIDTADLDRQGNGDHFESKLTYLDSQSGKLLDHYIAPDQIIAYDI